MNFKENHSLQNYNTFGVKAFAKQFISINSLDKLQLLVKNHKDFFLISGGSNILLTKDLDKLVVHLNLQGKHKESEDKNHVYITANAGENWHQFVLWCIEKNYGGLENLSLIPGNVGTCPIQNIGAYGVEVKDVISKVTALEITSGKLIEFSNKQCKFGYRDSIFKNENKGKYIIIAVTFKLTKSSHNLNYSYGAIKSQLELQQVNAPTIKNISDAVIAIRSLKLPDPKKIGNSGSFFKNPIISINHFSKLQKEYPDIPNYTISNSEIKIPAGWLIEKAGFKGKRFGDAGVHKNQALVLVNYGNATGKELYTLAQKIKKSILEKFGITLEIEVNII